MTVRVGADIDRPDDASGFAARGDCGDRPAKTKNVAGPRLLESRHRAIRDDKLLQVIADRGRVKIPVPIGWLTKKAAVNLGRIGLHTPLLNILVSARVELAQIGLIEQVKDPSLAGREQQMRM